MEPGPQRARAIYALTAVIALWSGWMQLGLLERVAMGDVPPEWELTSNDSREAVVAILNLVVLLGTAVVFLRWTYFANRNCRALGAARMEFTPGWAAGWYFVPIADLWKPFQAM